MFFKYQIYQAQHKEASTQLMESTFKNFGFKTIECHPNSLSLLGFTLSLSKLIFIWGAPLQMQGARYGHWLWP